MIRKIDHSPFDAASQSDDWLEDARAQEPIMRAAEKPFESQHAEASADELESRLGEIQKELASLKDEVKLLANIGDEKGSRATEGRVKFLQVEQRVIERMLQDMGGEIIEVQDDSVEATIAAEAKKEAMEDPDRQAEAIARAKVRADSLQPERTAARQTHREDGFFVAKSPRKTERAEALTRQQEAKARHEAAVAAVNTLRNERNRKWEEHDKEHEVEAFEKSFLNESAYPSETESIRHDIASEKAMSARVKPESFWSRTKRTWFGGESETQKGTQETDKAIDAVIAAQKAAEKKIQPSYDVRSSGIISARMGLIDKPSAQKMEEKKPGFFARLFKREKPVGSEFAKAQKIAGGSKYMRDGVALPPPDAVRLKLEAREAENKARMAAGKETIARYGTPPDSAKKDAA